MNENNSGFSDMFGTIPNQNVNPSKVPSVYNSIMSKIIGRKDLKVQPKIEIFELSSLNDRREYENLMLKISENPDEYHYIQAKDHWTKEGSYLRAIDYLILTEKEKKKNKKNEDDFNQPLSESIKKDLKDKLDSKHKELQSELTEEEKKKIEEEIISDDKKIEEAVAETEILTDGKVDEIPS